MFMEMDSDLFDARAKTFTEENAREIEREKQRKDTWKSVTEKAEAKKGTA